MEKTGESRLKRAENIRTIPSPDVFKSLPIAYNRIGALLI